MHKPVTKRSSPQNQGLVHTACNTGSADATEAITAKARMYPTRRISTGQA